MRLRRVLPIRPWAALAVALLVLGGCEDDVDPTLGTEQAFSLYGYLDPTADRQAIRVVALTGQLAADRSTEPLAATMTSTEAGTGRTAAWRDSVVTFLDGSTGHVFVADYTPTPGSRVTLSVTETEGAQRTTSVDVDIPQLVAGTVTRTDVDASGVGFRIRYAGAPRLLTAELRLRVVGAPAAPSDTVTLQVPTPLEIVNTGDGWEVSLRFVQTVRTYLNAENLRGLRLVEAQVAGFVADASWNTGGLSDEALVEPGTFSNVNRGFGFVGGGYESIGTWIPSISAQAQAGFSVDLDPASVLFINEVSREGWVEIYNPTLDGINLSGYSLKVGANPAQRFVGNAFVGPGGFYVISSDVSTVAPERISITNGAGAEVTGRGYEAEIDGERLGQTFGAWPDGRSFRPDRDSPDIFEGPLTPTRGGPNRLAEAPNMFLNEILTQDGGVEAYVDPLLVESPRFVRVFAASSEAGIFRAPPADDQGNGFFVARESTDPADPYLVLPQLGGEVLLFGVAGIQTPLGPSVTFSRVVDVYRYDPQSPKTSVGRIPDARTGVWTPNLRPSLGAPNAGAL